MTAFEVLNLALTMIGVRKTNVNNATGEETLRNLQVLRGVLSSIRKSYPFKVKKILDFSELADVQFVVIDSIVAFIGENSTVRYPLTRIDRTTYNQVATVPDVDGIPDVYLFEEFTEEGVDTRTITTYPLGTVYKFEVIGKTTDFDNVECNTEFTGPDFYQLWAAFETAKILSSFYIKPWSPDHEQNRVLMLKRVLANKDMDFSVDSIPAREDNNLRYRLRYYTNNGG
jgi:hypothetical protein